MPKAKATAGGDGVESSALFALNAAVKTSFDRP